MNRLHKTLPAILVIIAAVAFLSIGIWRGEDQTVYRKAVNICMECIGLG